MKTFSEFAYNKSQEGLAVAILESGVDTEEFFAHLNYIVEQAEGNEEVILNEFLGRMLTKMGMPGMGQMASDAGSAIAKGAGAAAGAVGDAASAARKGLGRAATAVKTGLGNAAQGVANSYKAGSQAGHLNKIVGQLDGVAQQLQAVGLANPEITGLFTRLKQSLQNAVQHVQTNRGSRLPNYGGGAAAPGGRTTGYTPQMA